VRHPFRIAAASLALILPALPLRAADAESPWLPVPKSRLAAPALGAAAPDTERVLVSDVYQAVAVDAPVLEAILRNAPLEDTDDARARTAVLQLPLPDGRFGRFRIEESPIMEPTLAAQFPELKTYRVLGLDDPTAFGRVSWTPMGFHGMVRSADGTFLVDPWSRTDRTNHVAYFKKDYRRKTPPEFRCLVGGKEVDETLLSRELQQTFGVAPEPAASFGPVVRVYDLAVAATGEYTQYHGGTVGDGQAAIVIAINRVNVIYESEVTVRLNLIDNTSIIFTNPASDPYTNDNGATMLCQNADTLDNLVGSYDIGHVFSTGGGGIAGLGVVCSNTASGGCPGTSASGSRKAFGVTGLPDPIGDVFYVDFVSHEIGHQFDADHTFNATSGFCGSAGQRIAGNAYEPGSGSTIMAYAGICDPQNIQLNSDDYFHAASLDQIDSYVTTGGGSACDAGVGTGNTPPGSVNAGPNRTIPARTPFALTGSATATESDPITYAWEQLDVGVASNATTRDDDVDAIRPIFRSFPPSSSPTRTFPELANVLTPPADCTQAYECLPTRNWQGGSAMTFRLTARDFHAASMTGAAASDDVDVTVVNTGAPFRVTLPVASTGWAAGVPADVEWAVAGTDASPISCANVKISLSTDNGTTFPNVLALSTPNDGTETVPVPGVAATTNARVKVECANNVFFNISAKFDIVGAAVSISNASPVVEGGAASFVVTLSAPASGPATVKYATANGTATAPGDYTAMTNGTVSFPTGESSQTVTITTLDDSLDENDETFFVNLSNPTGGIGISDGQGVGTITDNDPPPSISIADGSVTEGQTGQKNLNFTLTLSTASGRTVWVDYATADGSAIAGADYLAASGSLSIAAGQTAKALAVKVIGDAIPEGNESFNVNLSDNTTNPGTVTIADGQAVGTIVDDDQAGNFQFFSANYTVSEAAAAATIKVTRLNGSAGGVSVDYVLSNGSAQLGADVSGSSTGRLSFAAYASFAVFTIPIVRDTLDEPNEDLVLRLTNPQGFMAALDSPDTALLTIKDNDAGGRFQWGVATYNVKEAAGQAVLMVRRIGGSAQGASVDYATSDGSATLADGDYTQASGTLTFGAGVVARTLSVPINSDGAPEGSEAFTATLSNPQGGATLGPIPTATVNVAEDDGTAVYFDKLAYNVGEVTRNAVISVRRSGNLTGTSTVQYQTADGTATQPGDYLPASGTLTFLPNQALRAFAVPIVNDQVIGEGTETVELGLSSPTGATLGTQDGSLPGEVVLNIKDNDGAQTVEFVRTAYSVLETAPKVVLSVTRKGGAAGSVVVNYTTVDGTAMQPADYTLSSGTLTFAPGQATKTVAVSIVDDTETEGAHAFTMTLSLPMQPGVTLGALSTATVEIRDNEPAISFVRLKSTVSEVATKATVVARRTGSLAAQATVEYLITGGTASLGSDYGVATSGVLTFAPGKPTAALVVNLTQDTVDEPAETVVFQLQNPSCTPACGLGTPSQTTLTINDNDVAGKAQFKVASYSIAEDGGSIDITVTRTGGKSSAATIDFMTLPGDVSPAVPGSNYTNVSGTLTFGINETTKTFNVPVLDDDNASTVNSSVKLTLSTPGGNLALGKIVEAVLWIVHVP
jgi:hypothetical protein